MYWKKDMLTVFKKRDFLKALGMGTMVLCMGGMWGFTANAREITSVTPPSTGDSVDEDIIFKAGSELEITSGIYAANKNVTIDSGYGHNGPAVILGNGTFQHTQGTFHVNKGAMLSWFNAAGTVNNLTAEGYVYLSNFADLKTTGDTKFTKDSTLWLDFGNYQDLNDVDIFNTLPANGSGSESGAIIGSAGSKFIIENGATLRITNAQEGTNFTFVKGYDKIEKDEGFGTELGTMEDINLVINTLLEATVVDSAEGELTLKIVRNENALPAGSVAASTIDFVNSLGSDITNTSHSNAGTRYLARLFDPNFNSGTTAVSAAKTIEENAQLSAVSGSAGTAVYAATGASQNTMGRMGIGSSVQVQTVAKKNVLIADASPVPSLGNVFFETVPGWDKGFGVWFNPIYQNSRVRDMESGSSKAGYNANIGGASLGFDYTAAYNDKTDIRVGVQVHGGGGNSHSVDTISYASNDSDFIGGGIYAGVRREMGSGALYVAADLSYTATNNETEAHTNVGGVEADVDSNTFMAGLSAQYDINVNSFIVSPGIGVKYMHLNTDDYHSKVFGEAFFDTKIESQDVLSIPVSIGIAKNFILNNGWNISPSARLGVTFNAGDLDSDSISYLVGTNANPLSLSTTVLDDVVGNGTVGIQFGKNKISFGLDYSLDVSEHVTNHTVGAMVRYSF